MPPAPRAETISYGPRRAPDGRVNRFAELYGRHVPTYGIGARALLLRRGIPVLQERDGRGWVVEHRVDEEAAVRGDVVLPGSTAIDDARGKEHDRRAGLERTPGRGDRHRHHRAFGAEVRQFLAIGPPDGKGAAARRYERTPPSCRRNRAARTRGDKRPHVNFHPSRFVRHVGHPPAVRREHAVGFAEGGLQKYRWRAIAP